MTKWHVRIELKHTQISKVTTPLKQAHKSMSNLSVFKIVSGLSL